MDERGRELTTSLRIRVLGRHPKWMGWAVATEMACNKRAAVQRVPLATVCARRGLELGSRVGIPAPFHFSRERFVESNGSSDISEP